MTTRPTRDEEAAQGIACDLDAAGGAAQASRWLALGRAAGLGRADTEDGLLIRFSGELTTERELRALVAVESECCSWARWQVRRDGGELILDVRSTPEGAAILHTMFRDGEARG